MIQGYPYFRKPPSLVIFHLLLSHTVSPSHSKYCRYWKVSVVPPIFRCRRRRFTWLVSRQISVRFWLVIIWCYMMLYSFESTLKGCWIPVVGYVCYGLSKCLEYAVLIHATCITVCTLWYVHICSYAYCIIDIVQSHVSTCTCTDAHIHITVKAQWHPMTCTYRVLTPKKMTSHLGSRYLIISLVYMKCACMKRYTCIHV